MAEHLAEPESRRPSPRAAQGQYVGPASDCALECYGERSNGSGVRRRDKGRLYCRPITQLTCPVLNFFNGVDSSSLPPYELLNGGSPTRKRTANGYSVWSS
jgi:hypothetical protein